MSLFEFKELELQGAYLITNYYVGDSRGFFSKTFEKDIFDRAGIDFSVKEIFVSKSKKNVIRGLHFQFYNPQAKIVTAISGRIWDVIVDLRANSETYKKWKAYELSEDNHLGVFIPKGFAHGFASLSDDATMLYQCEGEYNSETDTGIIFDEPEIGIKWPVSKKDSILSPRDLQLLNWSEYQSYVNEHNDPVFG